jgi:DNA polymerase III subunit alpha
LIRIVHLHAHSIHSVLDGLLSTSELAEIGKESGAQSLTDHGSTSGIVSFVKDCLSIGVKPLPGIEAYYTHKDGGRHHVTLLARSTQGYKNILHLQTEGVKKNSKYTIIDLSLLSEMEDITVLSGCSTGRLMAVANEGSYAELEEEVEWWAGKFKHLYLEFQPNTAYMKAYLRLFSAGQKQGLPNVVTCDIHYAKREDLITYKNIHRIMTKKEPNLNLDWLYPFTDQQMHNYFVEQDFPKDFVRNAINNIDEIVSESNVELDFGRKWSFPVNEKEVWKICEDKILSMGVPVLPYMQQLSKEFTIFKQLDLLGYLQFCGNILDHCKDNDIPVGPGRGSVCGSLTAYLLNCTEINPLVHELSFERFLSPSFEKGLI